MATSIEMFNIARNAIFARFPQEVRGGNHDQTLIELKDRTFDAVTQLSHSVQDRDLNQLLMQAAYRVHTLPVAGLSWRQELLDGICSAFTVSDQILAYQEMSQCHEDFFDIAMAA